MIEVRYTETYDAIVSIDGVDLHDGHVIALKEDLYSFISDASKDANGTRRRLNIHEYTVAELEDLCDYYSKAAAEECAREERAHRAAEARFEKRVANLIECGAGDRATAIRWIRDAHREDAWCDLDECIRYALGLSWSYDLDHGDRDFFKRKAAVAA
jgi:hypothetical protein